ncbi:NACHT, LRR and PYD domains-containing protein 4 [Ictidomys tridecemlineatus]|uniref:NACHT, LRR and PYD domains-containing protein 4 n=1 Tax=Ictidomys tridecemlineatus TaxID=43179 RepID=UPI000B538FE6|nr:NACHT, LRR and PYD domains-containing protein 4 [Ictidomys tridecemlineatus]KAG3255993.1 NACHT, LRR and PYD domains-containing protein 4 [Ictidomys tridecemlineatus]
MAASFFSDFRLMWYLDELEKKEFMKFKDLLQQETVQRGLQPTPWVQVWKAIPHELASLMTKHYGEVLAWDLALCIFPKIHRKDLYDKATRESAESGYRAHIQKKFVSMWSRGSFSEIPGCFDQTLTREDHESLEEYFTPRVSRRRHTVVLLGIPRIGKTRFLMKLMLAWSDGTLYRDKFSFIFYLCCRELKQLTATSLAGLISRERPDDSVPLADIMAQPERILFIIDSLEELQCTLTEPESELCRDWREERSVKTVLSSLRRRKILPESALLLAAIPGRPEGLENKLDHPNMQELKCFQDSHVKQFFCCSFGDGGRAMAALSLVQNNEHLFTMCHVPLLCWMVCTSMKQEMQCRRDLAATCCRSTSVFLSFMFQAFTPRGATRPSQQGQGLLKALCSLAAEGMWTDTWVFGEEDLRRNGIADTDTPTLLELGLFRKYSESGSSYSFIHACMQEFCAAMFYLLDSPRDHPSRAVRPIEALLLTYFRKDGASRVFVGCFLFGLVHESEQQRLDALLGMQRSRELAPQLLGCLKNLVECKDPKNKVEFLLLFYALFEMQSDLFASHVMDSLREAHFPLREGPDLAVAAYCLKYGSWLREVTLSVPDTFLEERGPDPMSSRTLLRWQQFCCVLTANVHLQKLRVEDSILGKWALVSLCCQLSQPTCRVQSLETSNFSLCCETGIFFEVFTSNPNLQHLSMTCIQLSQDDVSLLCSALSNPLCNLQELLLKDSGISAKDCEALASMLVTNRKLKLLDLSNNALADGVPTLCAALRHPDCTLQTLVMAGCQICEHFCPHLSEVLLRNANLSHLDLSRNPLMDEGVAQLCEALRQPSCSLQTLWPREEPGDNRSLHCLLPCSLQRCQITMRICPALAIVLVSNPNLRSLDVGGNSIGDAGVRLLKEALLRSRCGLKELGLDSCQLTRGSFNDLARIIISTKSLHTLDLRSNPLDHKTVRQLTRVFLRTRKVLQRLRIDETLKEDQMEKVSMKRLTFYRVSSK